MADLPPIKPVYDGCHIYCPLCDTPMTLRVARWGPYFHCACYERKPIKGKDILQIYPRPEQKEARE